MSKNSLMLLMLLSFLAVIFPVAAVAMESVSSSSDEALVENVGNRPQRLFENIDYHLSKEPPRYNLEHPLIRTLKAASIYLLDEVLGRDKEDPQGLVVIFDVDGVLTNNPDPLPGDSVVPRKHAVELVRALKDKGVHLIASSAQPDLTHTVDRIRKLGLADCFNISEKSQAYEEVLSESVFVYNDGIFKRGLSAVRMGNVVSVHSFSEPSFPDFFRGKALSPLVAFHGQLEFIRHVVFLDDSKLNTELFESDTQKLHPFGKNDAKIDIILLADSEWDA